MTGDSGRADASCLSDGCGGTPAGLEAPGGSLPDDYLGGYCSTCRFWLFKAGRSPAGTVVEELDDGSRHRYYFNPAEPVVHTGNPGLHLGFGGTPWRVRFFDGRVVETNDLSGEGEIPARFRHLFPPNASLERLGSYGGDRTDGGPPLHLGGRTFGPAPADAATWLTMQGLAAMAGRDPRLSPAQVAAERQAASQTWDAALRAAHPDAAEAAASWEAVIGSPEHYANFEKYFTLQNGVGFSFPDDPRASYECFYAYALEPEPEAAAPPGPVAREFPERPAAAPRKGGRAARTANHASSTRHPGARAARLGWIQPGGDIRVERAQAGRLRPGPRRALAAR